MAQVTTKSQQRVEKFHSESIDPRKADRYQPSWKRSLLIAFHGTSASIYGFAICFQNVSESSAQLYLRSNPLVRDFGKWRFLTYNCLVMQFVAYSLCFTTHFVRRLRRPRDYFFTTFAFPIGMVVVFSFWSIWSIAGREYIFPVSLEPYYPPWLNHVTHTIIAPINMAELLLVKHNYSSDKKSLVPLTGYMATYISYILYIRIQTGRFVYPFLNKMGPMSVGGYIVGAATSAVIVYKIGKLIHGFVHGINLPRGKGQSKKLT